MAIVGKPRVYHKKFRYVVEIDGVESAAFATCSELSSEFEVIETREGGRIFAEKDAGLKSFDDVTLSRGVAEGDSDLYAWHELVGNAIADAGLVEPGYKRMVDIVQLNPAGRPVKRWRLHKAWPRRFVAGDWDNSASENVIEQVVLVFDFFTLVPA